MTKPTFTIISRNEVMEQLEDKLSQLPDIKLNEDNSELIIHSHHGKKTIQVTLEFDLQEDEEEDPA